MQKGFLVLETGEIFEGVFRGGQPRAGEVVFNTSHSGYEEIATDPSYFSQIMVMTAPMQGNYGADRGVWESGRVWIDGFVSLEIQSSARDQSWLKRLADGGVPILTDLDTRRIVMRLRESGTPWGALVPAASADEARAIAMKLINEKKQIDADWVFAVSRREPQICAGGRANGKRIALLDFGSKENIVRELLPFASEIAVFPSRTPGNIIREWNPDGLLLSNGPGNPMAVKDSVETVRTLLGWKPIFGICMGHQILSLALGGKTYKLKFGHRGSNHPVRDHLTESIYVTSQNHGYSVDPESLPSEVKVSHVNLNDGTVEGIEDSSKKCFSVQFHPESHPGPRDAKNLFSFFTERL